MYAVVQKIVNDFNICLLQVEKRIDFIQKEIQKLNVLAEGVQAKQKEQRQAVLQLQSKLQAGAAGQGAG